ncbi:hypothetical protein RHS01_06514 [Rhizoctonia solani]|uniref:Reverse transcriptase/retrotransposon-derived protein RNase H-like domain-containing protein n=1 Tax=Rhizoctonia solani TaxID=456999 RepID=A0A8H7IBR9_9AGAM|nr:hypothetical protein RHS01_06514 [Rhizoctonia solani]
MLNESSPQAGKIWKKAQLTFLIDGKHMTETFLVCNTRSHAAILGIKWLEHHNPEIDWNACTLFSPQTPPEHMAIAKEEEADKNPLKGVPSKYHQYAKEGPLNSPLYSMNNAKSATLKDWLRDKLKAGKIHPSKSSISSPVMFVPKKDGSCHLVVDYQRLNNWTKKNIYLLPCPNDLMAQLCGAKIFTKLDLQWGYNNICVKEGDKWKTAFCTKYGLYKSLVMTFGLTDTPAGFWVQPGQTQNPGVQEWPVPTKVKEVQSFLGLANFLWHFVANFSHMARPLHNLVKKDTPWKWNGKEQGAFEAIKDAITNAPVLCHANPTKPYFLEMDASSAALVPYSANSRKTVAFIHLASYQNCSREPSKITILTTRSS